MSDVKKQIGQKSFATTEQEAIVSLLFTAQSIRVTLEELCQPEGITLSQFNILRILKGIYPNAHPRAEIRKRMLDKADVTRLIDKLEAAGLVERIDPTHDGRHSLTKIAAKGLRLLDRLDSGFTQAHKKILSGLTKKELSLLIELVNKIK